MKMNEFMWKGEFSNMIEELEVPDNWNLHVDMNLVKQKTGLIYTQQTFGSFRCSHCTRSWNSSKVSVLFIINLNKRLRSGTVKMRIFKQGCECCTHPEERIPTVKSDNIERVLCNLVHKIQRKFYGVTDEYQHQKPKIYGPLEGLHNKERCEACRNGLCEQQILSCEYEQNREQRDSATSTALSALGLVTGVASIALIYFANK